MPYTKLKSPVLSSRLPAVIWRFLLKHLFLFLLFPLLFVVYPLAIPGIPITLDFPTLDTSDYALGKLWVWTEKGSLPALETISRFPIIGLWFVLGLIGINSEFISKFMIIIGFFIASFSFYFSFLLLFSGKATKVNPSSDSILKIAAVIGAIFFAYNPWSFERIHHWYLWIGYAILPLFFISIVYAFRNPTNLKYIASSILLWSFASTTSHMTIFYGLIFAIVFAAFILNNVFTRLRKINEFGTQVKKSERKNSAILLLIPFLSIVLLYTLINAYWIYPIILASQVRSISPNYLLVEENLEFLSKKTDFLNTFRLVASWEEQTIGRPIENTLFYYVWFSVSLALPIFGFSAVALSRKFVKYTSIFSAFAIIGIILAMGSQSPINYYNYVLENSILLDYGWLIRDPDKWSFLIAFTYSFLIGISSYKILERVGEKPSGLIVKGREGQGSLQERDINKKKGLVRGFFLFLLIASIAVYSYPVYKFNMFDELRPIPFPAEFDQLNHYLSGVNDHNVYFLPYPLDETSWNKINRVGNVYQTHSVKPSIESSGSTGMAGMESTNYYNYLANSVTKNHTKDIRNFIYPLGTSYLIFHNDTWDMRTNSPNKENLKLLEGIKSLIGLENIHNIGFYNIFKVDEYPGNTINESQPISIQNSNIAAVGGLDALQSLSSLQPSFSSLDSSLLFVDQLDASDGKENALNNSDLLILEKSPSYYDLLFSSVDSKYFLEPSKATIDYDPMRVWSKSGAMDPDNGVFHPYLENLGIDNWQFDYGKGLVITQATGVNLSVPMDISGNGQYDIFLRLLKNQEGGMINVYLDNKLLESINSLDEESNHFVWQQIIGDDSSSWYLKKGRHTLTLENIAGFNAINTFAIIPVTHIAKLEQKVSLIANKTSNIHFLEAESGFHNDKGTPINGTGEGYSLPRAINYLKEADDSNNPTSSKHENGDFGNIKPNTTLFGQLRVPENADLLKLKFLTKQVNGNYNHSKIISNHLNNTQLGSDYSIEKLKVIPAKERQIILASDFERNSASIPLAELRMPVWINHAKNTLSTAIDTKNPISGNASLNIKVRQGNGSEWSMISTDLLPINDESYYNFRLNVSAIDVNQLHGKVSYYDNDKRKISGDFISEERDGTFNDVYSASILPPSGAKYLRFEIHVRPITSDRTSYLIDDMRFEEIFPQVVSFNDRIDNFVSQGLLDRSVAEASRANHSLLLASHNDIYATAIPRDNNTDIGILTQETKPIPVIENSVYNFSLTLSGEQTRLAGESTKLENNSMLNKPVHEAVIAYFSNGEDVLENSKKFGQNASNGAVLTLSPGSQIYADLDILKPAYYTFALRTNPCGSCSFLTAAIVDKDSGSIARIENISLKEEGNNHYANKYYDASDTSVNNIDKDINSYNSNELKWLYPKSNVYLNKGKYQIKIYSDSNSNSTVDLDSVVVYSNKGGSSSMVSPERRENEKSEILDPKIESPAAYLEGYKKISPSKYEVEITNATRPYLISLGETYDPLWMASIDMDTRGNTNYDDNKNKDPTNVSHDLKTPKISSIPLYSIINGFHIKKTGDYMLTIEYQPQQWFMEGALISAVTTTVLLMLLLIPYIRILFRKVKLRYYDTKRS